MNNFGFEKLLAVLAVAFACVCMWGCGVDDGWGERVFADHFGSASIVGFIDDSLVIVADSKEWTQETPDYAIGGRGHQRLRVFNYRIQEDGPRWTDTLDNFVDEFDYVKGQVSDSVIWGAHGDELISFWKLGEKPVVKNISIKTEGCSRKFAVKSMRTWNDGLIWVSGIVFYGQRTNDLLNAEGDTCQYAVLDTVAGTLTFKRLDENLKWIQKCDDVRAWGDVVYCLKFDKEERTSSLFINDSLGYVLENNYYWTAGAVLQFQGNILLLERDVCMLENGKIRCFASASSNGISFKNKDKNEYITY